MANEQHLAILKEGVKTWNEWRNLHPKVKPDLRDAQITEAYLYEANLRHARLNRAKLNGSTLVDVDLTAATLEMAVLTDCTMLFANLTNANCTSAKFGDANLSNSNLIEAKLTNSDLSFANLTDAWVWGTDFHEATMDRTVIGDNDLSGARGLETVKHLGPSIIGIETIYRSKGRIPESFLLGCGVPSEFITFAPSLVAAAEGIQFYSCFISYSSKDEDFARRLHGKMRDSQLRVWFAPEDVQGGRKLHEQIETAIRIYDKLLIVLSEASLQSEWVMTELRKARKAERQSGKRKLFPMRLVDFETLRSWECFDADSGKDLAVELREYFIPDFSNWKDHDHFEAAFSRLLKDLRAEERVQLEC